MGSPARNLAPAAEPSEGVAVRLTDPALVLCLLRRAHATRSLVTVELPSGRACVSAILAVDPASGTFLLDELVPGEGHEELRRARRLRARMRVQGVEAEFEATVEAIESRRDGAVYRIPIPATVIYRQRRSHHRVPVPRRLGVTVRFVLPDGREGQGLLCDASLAGIGMEIEAEGGTGLSPRQVLERCELRLPDRSTVAGPLEVRFVGEIASGRRLRVGGRFLRLEPGDRRRLQRFVAALEREYARRCPKGEA